MRGKIENAQELLHTLRVLSGRKQEYDRVASAMEAVHTKDMEWCCRAGRKSIWSSRRSSGMETSSE